MLDFSRKGYFFYKIRMDTIDEKRNKEMICIRIRGGLGNQLFQYATAFSIAKRNNENLVLEITSYQTREWPRYELAKLHISPDQVINPRFGKSLFDRAFLNKIKKRWKIGLFTKRFAESGEVTKYHSNVLDIKKNTYLNGFFQNEQYFSDYRDELIRQFTPNIELEEKSIKWINEIYDCKSVAIHVRRGDYIKIGCGIGMDYYDSAIEVIADSVKQPHFFVFSDEIEFCKDYFKKYPQYEFSYIDDIPESENKDINEFFVMSKCRNQIIANSSFSWWAAWLNNNEQKVVVAPVVGMWTKEFYPQGWSTIDIEG